MHLSLLKILSIWSQAYKHRVLLPILLAAMLLPWEAKGQAPPQTPMTISEAFSFLAVEKTIAQRGASILKSYRRETADEDYIRGIQSYARAKGKFDGVIAQLKAELVLEGANRPSVNFQQALKAASEERIGFTTYVEKLYVEETAGTRNVFFITIFATVLEYLPNLNDVVMTIWQEYRQAKSDRQQEIMSQLDDYKWQSFDEVKLIRKREEK